MRQTRKIISWGLLFVLLIGLGQYAWRHRTEFEVITRISPITIVFLFCLHVLLVVIFSIRFNTILIHLGLRISFTHALRIIILGRFYNRFFPQLGNIYRAVILKSDYGFSISNYVIAFIAFIFLDRMISLFLAMLIILITEPDIIIGGYNMLALLALVFALALSFTVAMSYITIVWNDRISKLGNWAKQTNLFLQKLTICIRNIHVVIIMLGIGIINFLIGILQNWLCFSELGLNLSFAKLSVYNFIFEASRTVVLTPYNLAVTETAYGLLGYGMEDGAAYSIIVAAVLNIIGMIVIFILGIYFGGINWAKKLQKYRIKKGIRRRSTISLEEGFKKH